MNTELLDRIECFSIDEGAPALTFEQRLARENRWTDHFAARVVGEYKRFVYLAMTAGHAVTPSDQVDQAWHLHLTYSHSYWQRLCGDVLGRPLHHGPTRGGPAESARYDRQYEQTLAAYRAAFGEKPPADIWPPSAVRFGDDLHFARVNTARNWVVPKAAVKRGLALLLVAAGVIVFAAGCDPRLNPVGLKGLDFLWFYAPLALAALALGMVVQYALRGPGPQPFDDDEVRLDWADAAHLIGGKQRLATAAVAQLAGEKCVRVSDDRTRLEPCGLPARPLTPVEDAVYYSLPLDRTDRAAMDAAVARASEAFAPRVQELTADGFRVPLWKRCLAALVSVAPLAFVVGFGQSRVSYAVQNHVPCGALAAVVIVAAFACLVLLVAAFRRSSRRGGFVLKRLRATTDRTDQRAVGMIVALGGTAALAALVASGVEEFAALSAWYPRPVGAPGGCGTGCGAGGGGGGDGGGGGCGGGGCGGCGGCGG